jgi:ribosomal protein S18 acetylase RimI-like enzyme
VSLDAATEVTAELRQLWSEALDTLANIRGGAELLSEVLPDSLDPLTELVETDCVMVEQRDERLVGFAVVRHRTIVGVYVSPESRRLGVARDIAKGLFAMDAPPLDAFALPGDRATKSLYESLGLKARLLTMRAE